MMTVAEVKRWLNTLEKDADVAVDEGGLALVQVGTHGAIYCEVGGEPDEFDDVIIEGGPE